MLYGPICFLFSGFFYKIDFNKCPFYCGASGVAGGSLLLIPVACSLFGISNDIAMQVVGVGFIIGVIQDSCETALNSSTDVLFTAAAEFRQWKKEGRQISVYPNAE